MRYQDYVIKDGKFIGEFERLYQECENPWHQREEARISYSRADTVNSIQRYGLRNVLEVGCGLGFFTAYLAKHCQDTRITGMDISGTAIRKARAKFPEIEFFQGDLNQLDGAFFERYDGVLFSEIMWYVLGGLDRILQNIRMSIRGGTLMVNQTFYKEGQKYGCEFFTSQDEMIRYLGWDVLAKTSAEIAEVPLSYESHTVFRI